jgi:hypothetical protein
LDEFEKVVKVMQISRKFFLKNLILPLKLSKDFHWSKNTQRTMGNAPTTEQVYEINMAQMAVDLYNIWSKFDFIIKIQEP